MKVTIVAKTPLGEFSSIKQEATEDQLRNLQSFIETVASSGSYMNMEVMGYNGRTETVYLASNVIKNSIFVIQTEE